MNPTTPPIMFDKRTGISIEVITSGFLGHPVVTCIWQGSKLVAWATTKDSWRLGVNMLPSKK